MGISGGNVLFLITESQLMPAYSPQRFLGYVRIAAIQQKSTAPLSVVRAERLQWCVRVARNEKTERPALRIARTMLGCVAKENRPTQKITLEARLKFL
jgi:hypothetical protein